MEPLLFVWIITSIFLLPLPFIFILKTGRSNPAYKIGLVTLVVGKIIEASLNLTPTLWKLMYLSDPVMMAGGILLFVGLTKLKKENSSKTKYGSLVCGIILISTFMYGTAYGIYGVTDWTYPAVSIVYYTCFWALALCYLDLGDHHPLSFVGVFFVIINILICFSYDGGLFSGMITEEEYAAAPWYFSYMTQSIGGLFASLGVIFKDKLGTRNLRK